MSAIYYLFVVILQVQSVAVVYPPIVAQPRSSEDFRLVREAAARAQAANPNAATIPIGAQA
jgi:hypothetical protein